MGAGSGAPGTRLGATGGEPALTPDETGVAVIFTAGGASTGRVAAG
jgi:hypothetical protein